MDPPPAQSGLDDPKCQIKADTEKGPGYPFDLGVYETQVVPALVANCAASGCHGQPNGSGGFTVWKPTVKGECSFAETFNSLKANIDLSNPGQSKVVTAINGTLVGHPVKSDATAALLLDYATKAATLNGGPPQVIPPGANPFDYAVFQTQIAPILDAAGSGGAKCSNDGCHGTGAGNFKVTAGAAADSAEMLANFTAVTTKISLNGSAENSTFYVKATVLHAGGGSRVIAPSEGTKVLAWINDAIANNRPDQGNCPDVNLFNVNVFRDDILPVLHGDFAGGESCMRGGCHGDDRTGGALVLKETNTPEQNLASFVCFVDLTNPIASEVLQCPLGDQGAGCRKVHPGQAVFDDVNDPNFQRVLSYLYATKTTVAPMDFAFFARNINTIFNDVNAVQNGQANLTCGDVNACHGTVVAGQSAPNGSNFPILANLSDKASLQFNFSSAVNFTNFITPDGSSLFLYPTNEIANLANPFATGLPHPGGLDFAPDSVQALAILKWAKGLRPDGQGFLRDWLVAGDYGATLITTQTVIDEINATPVIFDPDGAAQFNAGQWDGFFSQNNEVDLNLVFPRAATAGRIAYAVAYVINTSAFDIEAQMNITSDNAIRVYVDKQAVLQADNASNGTTALANFPAFANSKKSTRVLIKVFQRANDNNFKFNVTLSDQNGNLLTDTTGELVIKLSPDGGI